MTMYHGCAVYRHDGTIVATHDFGGFKKPREILGTKTWEWFEDEEAIKTMFARALMGEPLPAAVVDLRADKVPGGYSAQCYYLPTGDRTLPVMGAFSTFPAVVRNLTPREREIARMLSSKTVKQIAAKLDISTSTVETLKGRIGLRLGIRGPELLAAVAELRDII